VFSKNNSPEGPVNQNTGPELDFIKAVNQLVTGHGCVGYFIAGK